MPVLQKTADSLSAFIQIAADLAQLNSHNRPTNVFRGGTTDPSELIPMIGRDLWVGSPPDVTRAKHLREEQALVLFEQRCVAYLKRRPANRLEAMIHARHHGLPTRLLDWTFSPLVALYFALTRWGRKESDDAMVYALTPPAELQHQTNAATREGIEKNPLDVPHMVFVMPPWINRRVAAQQSCFTLHEKIDQPAGPAGYIRIEASNVEPMRRALQSAGFTGEALFPDLDGLAKSITFQCFGAERPRRHEPVPVT